MEDEMVREQHQLNGHEFEQTLADRPGWIPESRRSAEEVGYPLKYSWASLVAQLVKNPLAMQETWVPSLGLEDPLEKGTTTHSLFWPGEFHGLYTVHGVAKVGHD